MDVLLNGHMAFNKGQKAFEKKFCLLVQKVGEEKCFL